VERDRAKALWGAAALAFYQGDFGAGRPLIDAKTPESLVLRGTPSELAAFAGQTLDRVSRRGKFLVFDFADRYPEAIAELTGRYRAGRRGWKARRGAAAGQACPDCRTRNARCRR